MARVSSDDYSESFMRFLKSKKQPNTQLRPQISLKEYTSSSEFERLNKLYNGNGSTLLDKAIKELCKAERIFFTGELYVLNEQTQNPQPPKTQSF